MTPQKTVGMHRYRFLVLLLILFVAGTTGWAQTADEVIAKYLDAIGGKEAVDKLKSQVVRGTFSLPDMGMEAPFESYVVLPDKSRFTVDMANFGGASSGQNGDVVWDINPMMGPRILEGEEREASLRRSQIVEFAHWKENFAGAEVTGNLEIRGMACTEVTFTPETGSPLKAYFATDSGLLTRTITTVAGQKTEANYTDYRDVEGIKIPFTMEIFLPQFTISFHNDSVAHNVEIPAEKFELPAEIQAMMK